MVPLGGQRHRHTGCIEGAYLYVEQPRHEVRRKGPLPEFSGDMVSLATDAAESASEGWSVDSNDKFDWNAMPEMKFSVIGDDNEVWAEVRPHEQLGWESRQREGGIYLKDRVGAEPLLGCRSL